MLFAPQCCKFVNYISVTCAGGRSQKEAIRKVRIVQLTMRTRMVMVTAMKKHVLLLKGSKNVSFLEPLKRQPADANSSCIIVYAMYCTVVSLRTLLVTLSVG